MTAWSAKLLGRVDDLGLSELVKYAQKVVPALRKASRAPLYTMRTGVRCSDASLWVDRR